jgi:hypothetical protein
LIAYSHGTYEQQFTAPIPDGGEVEWTDHGSWLAIFRKDGTEPEHPWGLHRLMWNTDLEPMPLESDPVPSPPPPAD